MSGSGPLRVVRACAASQVTQPLTRPVPADDARYLARKGPWRLAFRGVRRRAQVFLSGQLPHRRDAIAPAWRRALWIADDAPQIGDALTQLAARSLLVEQGIEVDLLTVPSLALLFGGDRWLRRATGDASAVASADHDFAIVSGDTRRALRTKRRVAPTLPWVSIAGAYSVPDYHRGLFGAQRIADLLGCRVDEAALRWHSRQKLAISCAISNDAGTAPQAGDVPEAPPVASPPLAIAVGGVHAGRIYRHWPVLVRRLCASRSIRVCLLGSANGRDAADAIASALPDGAELEDCVGRLDIRGSHSMLLSSAAIVCADGGLMHLAMTTGRPVVALFTSAVDPAWQLPLDFDGVVLRSESEQVSDIAPARILEAIDAVSTSRRRPPGRAGAGSDDRAAASDPRT